MNTLPITVREADPQRDYERLAEIISIHEQETITAERLHESDQHAVEGQISRKTVAVNANGEVVGYGTIGRASWSLAGRFYIQTIIDPAWRRQGIGAQVYDDNLQFAREYGADSFDTWVFENQPDGLGFAEKRGFTIERNIFESTIDLHNFDATRFAGVVEQVQASGLRLFSLAEIGNTREAWRKLWEVNYATFLDMPDSTGEFPNFDEFAKIWETSNWFRPDGQIVAADGDTYVGLSAVGYYKDSNSAYNMMTGVLADYRGRKIALALKLLSIRAAQRWGADYIRTNNDSQNAPMLAINRRLDYVAEPGGYRMRKVLNQEDSP
jgi:GNAT superfamily N-acetyltransferase